MTGAVLAASGTTSTAASKRCLRFGVVVRQYLSCRAKRRAQNTLGEIS